MKTTTNTHQARKKAILHAQKRMAAYDDIEREHLGNMLHILLGLDKPDPGH